VRSSQERHGIRLGMRVRDVDGKDLGRVSDLYDWAFGIEKGFPILFRRDFVATYSEVRGVADGVVTVARGERMLDDLAAGLIPGAWRLPVPPGFPSAATPPEARELVAELAAPRARPAPAPRPAPAAASAAPTPAEERAFVESDGQSIEPPPPAPPR
jgi:hypothetical protein